jgi:hypothetical protein
VTPQKVGTFQIRLDIYSLTNPDKDKPANILEVMQDKWTVETRGAFDHVAFLAEDVKPLASDIKIIAGAILATLAVIFWRWRPKKGDDEGGGEGEDDE